MKQLARSVGLARLSAPPRGLLHDLEVIPLRTLPAWVRWMYFELVLMSDFNTGFVRVHRAKLLSLLDCDQPAHGPRLQVPSTKMLRQGLDWLGMLGFANFDSEANKKGKVLEIFVLARDHFCSAERELGREQGRRATARKASNGAGSKDVVHTNRAENMARGSVIHPLSVGSPLVDNFSGSPMPEHVRSKLDSIKQAARGRSRAPKGA